jgi:hypothetical protein
MINKKILLAAFLVVLFGSCKKNYNCKCTNEFGSYDAGEVEGTKRQAKKQCAKLGSGPTTCDIS